MKALSQHNKSHCPVWRLSPLSTFVISTLFCVHAWANEPTAGSQDIAKNVEFDPAFLNLEKSDSVDLTRFANGSSATPGTYRIAVYVNNQPVSNEEIEFRAREDKTVYPCLTESVIKGINFNFDKLPKEVLAPFSTGDQCLDLQKQLPDAQVAFDSGEQRLDILIPQIYMNNSARGSVSPALWDSGIVAAMMGYNMNGYSSESQGTRYNSFYSGINAGLNMGAWYLRHNGSYSWSDNGPKKYSALNTYLQRDIPALTGRVLMGQSNTNGQLFDTLPFEGVQFASDDRMLPSSQRGYAPDIHGVARTNAQVTVRQSGQIIYQTTVSPGAFLINDLYPTGYGGDLVVTVREADGSENVYTVPYASVAQLLRPGANRYSLTLGNLRSDNIKSRPGLYEGTWQRGISNIITGYGGAQFSEHYSAVKLGMALGSSFGAWSFDATQAQTQLGHEDGSMSGQSYQVSYSKNITETNSNLSIAAWRFSTNGYMDYMTAMQARDVVQEGYSADTIWRAKSRATITAGQGLPEGWGQFYISASLQKYWNKNGNDQQYQMGYSNRYKTVTYNMNVTRTYSFMGDAQNNVMLSLSFPLGRDNAASSPQMRIDLNRDTGGRMGEQVNLSGSAGSENQYSYGVTAMRANQGAGTSGSANLQYRSPWASMNGTYSVGDRYSSASVGLSGTALVHSGGVTLSPYTGDTFALIEAKGAEGAKVSSYSGIHVDSHGYALVPYLNPYQINDVSIDPMGTSTDVELLNTSQRVAPYSGAVVKLKYDTKHGTPIFIAATFNDEPVPFGANVFDSKGNNVGAVGQGGQVYARVERDHDELKVSWGEERNMRCVISYRLMPQQKGKKLSEIQQFTSVCHSSSNQVDVGQKIAASEITSADPNG